MKVHIALLLLTSRVANCQELQVIGPAYDCRATERAAVEQNSRRMTVAIRLDRAAYLPGEIMKATVQVTNPTPELIEVFDPSTTSYATGADRFVQLRRLPEPDPESGSLWSEWPMHRGLYCGAATLWLQPGRSFEYSEDLVATAIDGERIRVHFDYYGATPHAEYVGLPSETIDFVEGEWQASEEYRARTGYKGLVWRYAAILRSADKYYAVAGVRSQNTLLRGNRFSPTTMGVIPTHFVRLAESPIPLAGLSLAGPGENDITISWRNAAGLRAAARVQGQAKELRVAKADR